jgi:hypothetical protein
MSEDTATRKGKAPTEPPRIDVIERSSQTDYDLLLEKIIQDRERDPFGSISKPIALTDPSLEPHWFNRAKYPDAIPQAKAKGWRGVTLDMIMDKDQLGDYGVSPDSFVVRGERGDELLMCMPKEYVKRIQMAKTYENNRRMGNPNAARSEALEAYGKNNPDGAEEIYKQGEVKHVGRVTTKVEKIQVRPEE